MTSFRPFKSLTHSLCPWSLQRLVAGFERVPLAQLLRNESPDSNLRPFTSRKRDQLSSSFEGSLVVASHHWLAVLSIFCKKTNGKHVVGLTSTHALGQSKDPILSRSSFQSFEDAFIKLAHPLRDVILGKKGIAINRCLAH